MNDDESAFWDCFSLEGHMCDWLIGFEKHSLAAECLWMWMCTCGLGGLCHCSASLEPLITHLRCLRLPLFLLELMAGLDHKFRLCN
ncbi:hypothetical protein Q8A67_024614 [Cirrhinus molitorella]|uniref:Uncharacterized protein n=1 Tax=Cirrhinus molitorella TaxID=172907 RepID=A0AA88P4X6_9TELE|nr:hypothetical protein Q8A67_024614 [Cirrhinus molitorella]